MPLPRLFSDSRRSWTKGASGPRSHRPSGMAKPRLGRERTASGNTAAHRALEQGLPFAVLELKVRRDGGRELDEPVIEQRHPRLDRVGHAHPVDLGQDVERQVAVEIGVLQGRQPVCRTGGAPGALGPPRVLAADQRRGLGREQSREPVAPEQRDRVEIAVDVGQRDVAQVVAAPHAVGHPARKIPERAAREAGKDPVPPLAALDDVLVVPGEQLVAAVAGQHHLHRPGGEPGHHVGGDGGGVAERLVEMPREVLEVAERLGSQHELVVLRREGPGDLAGVRELVVVRLAEPDGEGLHRRAAEPRHRGDDGARVDAAAQEGAEGHVAHEVQADRLVDERGEPLGELRSPRPAVRLEAHVPVALDARGGARSREQAMAGLELLHPRDDAAARAASPGRSGDGRARTSPGAARRREAASSAFSSEAKKSRPPTSA